MRIAKINMLLMLPISLIMLASCGTSQHVLNQVEDDVYYSRKQSTPKEVYVPEVDVNEIMKNNPPQYGNGKPIEEPVYTPNYSGYDNTNPNAAAGYQAYQNKYNAPQQPDNSNNAVTTTPPPANYDYNGNSSYYQNGYSNTNNYSGFYNNYNQGFYSSNYYGYAPNYGWNTYSGIRIGWGSRWGRRSRLGWRTSYFYDPFGYSYGYTPYCSPYTSYYGGYYNPWGGYYGWNYGYPNYYYGSGYYGGGNNYHHGNESKSNPRVQAPRHDAGTSIPRTGMVQQMPPAGNTVQAPITPVPDPNRVALPNTNQPQLINKDGKQVYVAPEQYRATPPPTYNTYRPSVDQGKAYRAVVPPPVQQPTPPAYNRNNPAPAQQAPQQNPQVVMPPNGNTSPPPAPRMSYPAPSGGGSPSFGGGRSGGGGGNSGGGRVSMPRPR